MRYLMFAILGLAVAACSAETGGSGGGDAELRRAFGPYLGVWESEDGQIRQAFLMVDDGAAVEGCMMLAEEDGEGWRVVSDGRYVLDETADETRVTGRFTGEGMGFEAIDVVGYPVEGGGFDFTNTARTGDGRQITYETWAAPAGGAFAYVIERADPAGQTPWLGGRWIFVGGAEADCSGGEAEG